jgi:hypothetical protein
VQLSVALGNKQGVQMCPNNLSEHLPEEVVSNEPLYVKGGVEGEPVKYLAVKPYELDKYEFSVLKKKFENKSMWFNASIGATAGFIILLLAKMIQLGISQQPIKLELHEIIVVVIGALTAWLLRKPKISEDETEQLDLVKDVGDWFSQNPNRNIHVTPKRGK